jgi:hypothetical protein
MESKILNSMATQTPSTENPSISLSANRINNAFTTNKNNPKVTMVIGNVRMTNIGFTKRFNIDNTIATITAVAIALNIELKKLLEFVSEN